MSTSRPDTLYSNEVVDKSCFGGDGGGDDHAEKRNLREALLRGGGFVVDDAGVCNMRPPDKNHVYWAVDPGFALRRDEKLAVSQAQLRAI